LALLLFHLLELGLALFTVRIDCDYLLFILLILLTILPTLLGQVRIDLWCELLQVRSVGEGGCVVQVHWFFDSVQKLVALHELL
jgi:hypothetical protein